jgi:hypothetical protein
VVLFLIRLVVLALHRPLLVQALLEPVVVAVDIKIKVQQSQPGVLVEEVLEPLVQPFLLLELPILEAVVEVEMRLLDQEDLVLRAVQV